MTEETEVDSYDSLSEYERGFYDALWLYAWWKDGVLYVGSTGRTFKEAWEDFISKRRRYAE